MRGVKDFLTSSIPHMVDYIVIVSTPEPQSPSNASPQPFDKNDRRIASTLHRLASLTGILVPCKSTLRFKLAGDLCGELLIASLDCLCMSFRKSVVRTDKLPAF